MLEGSIRSTGYSRYGYSPDQSPRSAVTGTAEPLLSVRVRDLDNRAADSYCSASSSVGRGSVPGTATSYRKFAASAALFFLATAAFAHPHLFFDVQLTVRAGTKGVEGVTLAWTFDKWFSASILLDYDVDGDRWFDETETQSVFDQAFSALPGLWWETSENARLRA